MDLLLNNFILIIFICHKKIINGIVCDRVTHYLIFFLLQHSIGAEEEEEIKTDGQKRGRTEFDSISAT
jgi:hypothetical protein